MSMEWRKENWAQRLGVLQTWEDSAVVFLGPGVGGREYSNEANVYAIKEAQRVFQRIWGSVFL